jgi:hypothetical protein
MEVNTQPKTAVSRYCFPLHTANVAYFLRKIQLSGFYAYPDGSPTQLIRLSGVLLYCVRAVQCTDCTVYGLIVFVHTYTSFPKLFTFWRPHKLGTPFIFIVPVPSVLPKLTSCSRVLLEKLPDPQLVKKYPILWKPKVNYRFYKSPPLAPLFS